MIRRIIVAGGGTGGHLFPGIAVVEELRRRQPDVEVTFVGTEKGIEARVIPERGERLELIEVAPLKGRSAAELMRSLVMLPGAFSRASGLISELRPDLVIGVGGYASGPMLLAAAARGVPTAILEQNAHVGLTNRVLAPITGRAYVAFEEAAEVVSFVDDMAKAYASAALVIARAGATTLAEVCAIGRPAILVPYPHAADDHQARNAEALERAGAAVCIRESALDPDALAAQVARLLDGASARKTMAEAARAHGRPDAAAAIVDDLVAWLGGPSEPRERSVGRSGRGKGDGGAKLASVSFAGRRDIAMFHKKRRRRTPPPAYLQVITPADAVR